MTSSTVFYSNEWAFAFLAGDLSWSRTFPTNLCFIRVEKKLWIDILQRTNDFSVLEKQAQSFILDAPLGFNSITLGLRIFRPSERKKFVYMAPLSLLIEVPHAKSPVMKVFLTSTELTRPCFYSCGPGDSSDESCTGVRPDILKYVL